MNRNKTLLWVLIVLAVIAFVGFITFIASRPGEPPHRHKLVAVSTDQATEGSIGGNFLFISGSIESEERIYFYAVQHDGSIQMGWRNAFSARIFEDVEPGGDAYLYGRYEFHVPKGSIVRSTKMPLPGQQ